MALLREVDGIADAVFDRDADGAGGGGRSNGDDPGTLRLDLRPGVDEVSVATSVGLLLRERFGLGIDLDRLALVEDVDLVAGAGLVDSCRMHVVFADSRVAVTVTVGRGPRLCVGTAAGETGTSGVLHAVGEATLIAATGLLDTPVTYALVRAEVLTGGGSRAVRTVLRASSAAGGEDSVRLLAGRSKARDDLRQATVRAVLRALADQLC
jgi:hypothetical protein